MIHVPKAVASDIIYLDISRTLWWSQVLWKLSSLRVFATDILQRKNP